MNKDRFFDELQRCVPSVKAVETKIGKLYITLNDEKQIRISMYTTKPYTRKNILAARQDIATEFVLRKIINSRTTEGRQS